MDIILLLQIILIAIVAAVVYTIIGVAPGTDETAVLAPVTLALVLSGMQPILILSFFMSAIIAKKLTDSIPVATAGIPGGVMAAPMVEHALILKEHGQSNMSIRKMASGSVIGTLVSVPISLFLANLLVPLKDYITKDNIAILFFVGTIILALMCKNKILALLSILPFAMLIQGMRHLYWGIEVVPENKTIFISLFLAITIGPFILSLFELLDKKTFQKKEKVEIKEIILHTQDKEQKGFPNPFKILDKKEIATSAMASFIGSITFFLSPVGMTILLGELFSSNVKDPVKKAARAISSMDALSNATYISGTLIPLIAIGIPMTAMSMGPANPLFNAPPVLTLEHNLHHILSMNDIVIATIIGAIVALSITYFATIRYSSQICKLIFKKIPHEAILGMFFALVILIAYMEGGLINIFGVLLVGLFAGILNRWGINYGVLFMILYCAPWVTNLLKW